MAHELFSVSLQCDRRLAARSICRNGKHGQQGSTFYISRGTQSDVGSASPFSISCEGISRIAYSEATEFPGALKDTTSFKTKKRNLSSELTLNSHFAAAIFSM